MAEPWHCRLLALPDGRTLLRNGDRTAIWQQPGYADLENVLSLWAEHATWAALKQTLTTIYAEEDVEVLLKTLAPWLMKKPVLDQQTPLLPWVPMQGFRCVLVGEGSLAVDLAAHLGVAHVGLPAREPAWQTGAWPPLPMLDQSQGQWHGLDGPLQNRPLVLAVVEQGCFGDLYGIGAKAFAAGCAVLWLQCDDHGFQLGPLTDGHGSACVLCHHHQVYAPLNIDSDQLRNVLAPMRLGKTDMPAIVIDAVSDALRRWWHGDAQHLLQGVEYGRGAARGWRAVAKNDQCGLCHSLKDGHKVSHATAQNDQRRLPLIRSAQKPPPQQVQSVGILGGGTAGYLAALALRRYRPDLDVTLIASADVPIIGVGEATTPLMPQFLHGDLGIDLHAFFQAVQPTMKLGIRFEWGGGKPFDYPFGDIDPHAAYDYDGHLCGLPQQGHWMETGRLPIGADAAGQWTWQGDHQVAYHLDNRRFVAFLQNQARAAGVKHINAKVVDAAVAAGQVLHLCTEDGRRLTHDFYLDCSGFRAMLLEKTLGGKFQSFADDLPTDRAVVAQVKHEGSIRPFTTATAMSAGWCWRTPQVGADHRGYVYSHAFIDDAAAEAEMRAANPGMGRARIIRFRTGRHANAWLGNVVALGNAYGFVEPLESTALHMLIRQILWLIPCLPTYSDEAVVHYNRRCGDAWDYLRWFLTLHYRFNCDLKTPFWDHVRSGATDDAFASLIGLFKTQGPLTGLFGDDRWYGSDPLWGPEGIDTILLGQGLGPGESSPACDQKTWQDLKATLVDQPGVLHREFLENWHRHPQLLQQLAACFQAAGPALS